jgi:hypothetical protein
VFTHTEEANLLSLSLSAQPNDPNYRLRVYNPGHSPEGVMEQKLAELQHSSVLNSLLAQFTKSLKQVAGVLTPGYTDD